MPFDGPLKLSYIGDGRYELSELAVYRGRDQHIQISAGFKTDLASSPRIFWALIPPHGAYEEAAVLHDWLCKDLRWCHEYNLRQPEGGLMAVPSVDAVDTDGLFRRVMREGHVPFATRWAMWAGVRWSALTEPARRENWHTTAGPVLAITAAEAVTLFGTLFGVHKLFDRIGTLGRRLR